MSVTVEEVLAEVMKDECFYRNSGGEPVAQLDFTCALLAAPKEKGLDTCIETPGLSSAARIERIAPLVDLFLFDYKMTDCDLRRRYTGVPNDGILENLHRIDALGGKAVWTARSFRR